jgi:hypothetical protein
MLFGSGLPGFDPLDVWRNEYPFIELGIEIKFSQLFGMLIIDGLCFGISQSDIEFAFQYDLSETNAAAPCLPDAEPMRQFIAVLSITPENGKVVGNQLIEGYTITLSVAGQWLLMSEYPKVSFPAFFGK